MNEMDREWEWKGKSHRIYIYLFGLYKQKKSSGKQRSRSLLIQKTFSFSVVKEVTRWTMNARMDEGRFWQWLGSKIKVEEFWLEFVMSGAFQWVEYWIMPLIHAKWLLIYWWGDQMVGFEAKNLWFPFSWMWKLRGLIFDWFQNFLDFYSEHE